MVRERNGKVLSAVICTLGVLLLLTPNVFAQFNVGGVRKFVISGSTGAPDVTLRGFQNGPITSDSGGFYSVEVTYGWSGVVTPDKEGYTFQPASQKFESVKADQVGRDFVATMRTYRIAGTVGMSGVQLEGFPDGAVAVEENGRYTVEVPYGWSGTVTPYLEGFTFKPATREYTLVKRDMTTDNYIAAKLMFEIAGVVSVSQGPVPGVVMKGLPGDPVTGPGGRYTTKVDYNWSGTVTPTKDGYIFDPPGKPYDPVNFPMTTEDFFGEAIQYTVSGTVGVGGVKLTGLPGNVISGSDGYFAAQVNYGFTGPVTPVKDGYKFQPVNRALNNVRADVIGQDFKAEEIMVKIAGSVGKPEVQMQGLPTADGQTVVSNAQGRYEAVVSYGWYGEVRPAKEGYTFTPQVQLYEGVTRDRKSENYRASLIKYEISGRIHRDGIGQEKVELRGFPSRVYTNLGGEFTTKVPHGWSGRVTPMSGGLEFNPPEFQFSDVRQDMLNQDFSASEKKYTISGRINSTQGPIEGVTVMTALGSTISSVTDSDGRFSLTVPHNWKGQVSFVGEGYTFQPPHRKIQSVVQDMTINVTATVKTFKILGEIVIMGQPVSGVSITAAPGDMQDTTDSRGRFAIEVPYGWSGDVIAAKEGWEFIPDRKTYDMVTTDINERAEAAVPPTQSQPTDPPSVPDDPFPTDTRDSQPLAADPDPTTPPAQDAGDGTISNADSGDGTLPGVRPTGNVIPIPPETGGTTPIGQGPIINNAFLDSELIEILQEIAADADVTIVTDPEISALVSAVLTNVPLETALDIVLAGTGYQWKKTPYYYLVSSVATDSRSFVEGSETRHMKMSYLTAKDAIQMLAQPFQQYARAELAEGGRKISITAPRRLLERIEDDLRSMDTRPRQVLLEARIVTMEKGDLLNMGVEWG